MYFYLQLHQKMVSQGKHEAAMATLEHLYRKSPRWIIGDINPPRLHRQTGLAVALARTGDIAGAQTLMDILLEAGEQLYPKSYEEERLSGTEGETVYKTFAEIYLIDHAISPDGAGLDEFEKSVPDKDRGKGLRYLGHVLQDQGKKEAALAVFRRALEVLEPGSKSRQKVQEEVQKLQAAGGEGAGQR